MKTLSNKRKKRALRLMYEITSIKWLAVGILCLMLLAYCTWMCVHYNTYHFMSADITSKPADYFGMIVGFFTLLITLLVGWQIYNTIKAKEELLEYKEMFDEISTLKQKLAQMEKCFNQDKDKYIDAEAKTHIREPQPVQINVPQSMIDFVQNDIAKKGSPLWEWLSRMVDGVRTDADILKEYNEIKDKKPKKVAYIGGRMATGAEVIALLEEVRPIKMMIINATNKND